MTYKKDEVDPKTLRYVLYARKSSEDETSQEKSIPDQIKYCKDMAEYEGITILRIFQEAKSAKKSNNRPEFNTMIKEIKKGVYDAIISYHPDRLARNSLESGMLIDMLDNNIIKDLKFPTCQFENNASGKLLLNILFAMSKQYSEHLSEVVKRGVDTNLEHGKSSGKVVWGYSRDQKTGFYAPDNNFDAIRRGWDMRLEGKTQTEVARFWRVNNVYRDNISQKAKNQITKLSSKQQASKIFKEPMYYGVLIQAGNERDLREIPEASFQPMISEAEYNKVQMMDYSKRPNARNKKGQTFYPLRRFVKCSCCGDFMTVGPSTSKSGKKYLYYRCDNKDCVMKGKSIRAKVLFDALYSELEKLKFTESIYKSFLEKAESITNAKLTELKTNRKSLVGAMVGLDIEIKRVAEKFSDLSNSDHKVAASQFEKKLEDLEDQKIDLEQQISEIDNLMVDPSKIQMSLEEFLNLANSASDKMKAGTSVQKDVLCRILFLNIVLDKEKGATFLWKNPFSMVINNRLVNSGGRRGT
ncbi:MAG: recombinase family protein [Candidatus Nanosyncoccaceae bacterium]